MGKVKEADGEKIRRAIEKREKTEITKRNLAEYYKEFTRWHRPWMRELLDRYMTEGDFGIHPLLIAARYEKPMDIEVALTASLLVKSTDVAKILEYTKKVSEVITDTPYVWLSSRSYVHLFDPKMRDEIMFGNVRYGKLAVLMNNLYEIYSEHGSLENFVKWNGAKEIPAEALASQLQYWHGGKERVKIGDLTYPVTLMLAYLSRRDGIGMGIWSEPVENLHPMDCRTISFVDTFFYKRCRYFTLSEKTELMGFIDGMELFYAALAYQTLRERKPEECNRYERLFGKRLSRRSPTAKKNADMRKIIPGF